MDPYRVLEVPRDADGAAVRRAYHRQARRRHPDVGGTTAAMRELNAAYAMVTAARRLATDPRAPVGQRPDHPPAGAHRAPAPRARRPVAVLHGWLRLWLTGTRSGQWVVTLALGLAVHAVALWSAPPWSEPRILELLALLLAVRLQASATPAGRRFAPPRDLRAVALAALSGIGWFASRW
jgi:hypothetical protein